MNLLSVIPQVLITLGFVALYALFAVYAERKVSAWIQNRMGPMETGPHGLFQTLADILKLILKEGIVPANADGWIFRAAPVVIFVSVFSGFAVLPLFAGFGAAINAGVLFVIAIVSIDVIGIFMAGWGSNNKFSIIGALRSVSQILSYEIPAGLALLAAVVMYGTLDLGEISMQQGIYSEKSLYFLGLWDVKDLGGITAWGAIRYPHLFIAWFIYFVATLAECNRAPFDLPEAESELISGYHTEYSGFRFAVIMLAEYANMFLVSVLGAVIFLGGWNTLLPNLHLGTTDIPLASWTSGAPGTIAGMCWGLFWILLKAFSAVFVHMWLRWTLPRFRADQLLRLGWKVLTPAGLLLVCLSGIWKAMEVLGHI